MIPPISWFAALFEQIRGARQPTIAPLAHVATVVMSGLNSELLPTIATAFWQASIWPFSRAFTTSLFEL